MPPQWGRSDWLTLAFWAGIAVYVAAWEAALLLSGSGTVSATTHRWCCASPWVRAAVIAACLGLAWHLILAWWPFAGE